MEGEAMNLSEFRNLMYSILPIKGRKTITVPAKSLVSELERVQPIILKMDVEGDAVVGVSLTVLTGGSRVNAIGEHLV